MSPGAKLVVGRWYNFHPKPGGKPLNEFTDGSGWRIALHAGKLTQLTDTSWIEVAFPSDPQKHFDVITTRAKDAAAHGQPRQENAAFQEWERSVQQWTTRKIDRAELTRITLIQLPPWPVPNAAPRDAR